ncbi:MAG: hypothetical protein HYT48_03170 [Candidatus Vogelbacteria bacterium]|nr:hypothetical protein [Candidatus Vogelbacteria bacterium]
MKKTIFAVALLALVLVGSAQAFELSGCQLGAAPILGRDWDECEQFIYEFTDQAQAPAEEPDLKDQIFALLQEIAVLNAQLEALALSQ